LVTGARKVRPKPGIPRHAQQLLLIRQQRHWTQLDLANALNVSRETISRWERGIKEPHPAWMRLVRNLLEKP
jgi:transcriptional regulator with XRE-family HTH domain